MKESKHLILRISFLLLIGLLFSNLLAAQDSLNFNMTLRSVIEFPDKLANIWGYSQNGSEYALVGLRGGTSIVDISNPDAPQNIAFFPGPYSTWREIKTYGHYAYVVNEAVGGIQIINLAALPSPVLSNYFFNGVSSSHTLHIDITKGFLYTYGSSNPQGGATVFDLKPDPYHPVLVGTYSESGYIHDGYVDNDTLYACHINAGYFSMVDMHDKANPQVLGTMDTPGFFTHSSWLLNDRKHLLTTDERRPSFVTAYDVSDPSDIRETDRIATSPNGRSSIAHNIHVLNDWAVTSWYIDGVVIIDAHRPDNLVQVARYDTYDFPGYFDGCWGVYPAFPSKNIIAGNIATEPDAVGGSLYILTPTYKRACYLEGKVTHSVTGMALSGVSINIAGDDPLNHAVTRLDGSYKTGQAASGSFAVTISKTGFIPQTRTVLLNAGEVTNIDAALEPVQEYQTTIKILDGQTGQPLPNTPVVVSSTLGIQALSTDAAGLLKLTCTPDTTYLISTSVWGYLPARFMFQNRAFAIVYLQSGYYDDFGTDLNWTVGGNLVEPQWTREIPDLELFTNVSAPENDLNQDGNNACYLTGNGHNSFVLDGYVSLNSPVMRLRDYREARLSFWYWYNYLNSHAQNDFFQVVATNGLETVTVFEQNSKSTAWKFSNDIYLGQYIELTDSVQIHFIVQQGSFDNPAESAIDLFQVVPIGLKTGNVEPDVLVGSNPTHTFFSVWYNWPGREGQIVLEVRNVLGQMVWSQELTALSGTVEFGTTFPNGMYFATLRNGDSRSAPVKLLKQ